MRGTIDFDNKVIRLSGQILFSPNDSLACSVNPFAICLPVSTTTSTFTRLPSAPHDLPFANILWVENTNQPNEVEVTYAYPTDHVFETEQISSDFQLPYQDAKRKLVPNTQLITIDFSGTATSGENHDIREILLRHAYPHMNEKIQPQRIYVLINPHSGKGEALEIFNKEVKPILTSAHCKLTIKLTEYHGHATELAENLNIDDYDTILCASGDGTPYEVINGFYKRKDRAKAFNKINIVQTPGGSGNAMSLSCLGATSASLAALRILKGKSSQCDLMAVCKSSSDEVVLSFLSQTYGAIAQADIGTEWIRWIGGIRFDLGVVYQLLKDTKYPCELAVKLKCKGNDEISKHYEEMMKAPKKEEPITEENFKLHYYDDFKESARMENLPAGWEVYDSNVTLNNRIFYAGKMPYIAASTNFFPAALPTDGSIDLIVFDSRSKFLSTANALMSLDKGTHVWEDGVKHFKVEAFRLIPKSSKKCFISVDGEWFPYEPFQVEILNKVLRTILWDDEFTVTGYLENRN
ncbi:hypothetical protein CANINC_005073 [Pichia inconspicua]|uniref:DAGKc domain-containing protein n=1 Tax=Pichia inconspicua TaxID=52247 RepID=A0A4V4NF15_9ASCO|nr:hypothetical protein CANINC_005073 [[Candida] inconspicua]